MNATIESTFNTSAGINHFTGVDYTVFAAMLGISAAIGLYFGCCQKGEQTTEEYLLGGRKMKTIPIAISLVASQLSAISIMTLPVESYSFGSQYMQFIPNLILIVICVNYVYLPVFYHNNIDNCYAYLEMRFSRTVRNVITASFALIAIMILPIMLFVPSLAFSQVTGFNIHVINSIVSFVCIFYTMLGGIKAVVWTDVIQAFIMVLSIVLVAVIGVVKVGGVGEVWRRGVEGGRIMPFDFTFDLSTRTTIWNLAFGYYIMWLVHVILNQSCVQRIVSLPTLSHARRALIYFCFGVIFIMGINILTGLIMFAYYHNCDPVAAQIINKHDKMVPHFVSDIVGHLSGMPGIFISCVFSASLSTVSATMNSLSGIAYNDYIRPMNLFKHNDSNANLTMKLVTIAIGLLSVLGGVAIEHFKSIFQLVNTITGCTTGAMFGVFTLGMVYPWANAKGALYGVLASMSGMFWIITGAQYLISTGELKYTILPVRTDGCDASLLTTVVANVTEAVDAIVNATTTTILPAIEEGTEDTFSIYKMSFLWYPFAGAFICISIGIIVSHLTGSQNLEKLDINLISPVAQFLIPRRLRHTEMQLYTATKLPQEKGALKEGTEWIWKNSHSILDTNDKEMESLKQ